MMCTVFRLGLSPFLHPVFWIMVKPVNYLDTFRERNYHGDGEQKDGRSLGPPLVLSKAATTVLHHLLSFYYIKREIASVILFHHSYLGYLELATCILINESR